MLQTVIDLKEMGYQPVLVEDCISSRNLHDKEIALLRARDEGALLTTSESILFELTVTAEMGWVWGAVLVISAVSATFCEASGIMVEAQHHKLTTTY